MPEQALCEIPLSLRLVAKINLQNFHAVQKQLAYLAIVFWDKPGLADSKGAEIHCTTIALSITRLFLFMEHVFRGT